MPSTDVIVRDPVVVTMSPPRFLRLDDVSRLLVEINNVSGPAGDYKIELLTGEGLTTDAAEQTITLATGDRTSLDLPLTATAIGDQDLRLLITQPDGTALVKELTLGVRAASGPQTTATLIPLPAGETMTLDAAYFDGIVPHSASLTAAIGPFARLDVPGPAHEARPLPLWVRRAGDEPRHAAPLSQRGRGDARARHRR